MTFHSPTRITSAIAFPCHCCKVEISGKFDINFGPFSMLFEEIVSRKSLVIFAQDGRLQSEKFSKFV